MIQTELLSSDHICLGERVISSHDLKEEFPEWYEKRKQINDEKNLNDYCMIPDYSYGISATLNAIYSIDFEKATAEYLCSFEDEKNQGGLYFPPIRIGKKLLFAPIKACRWAYYNLDTCTWNYEDVAIENMSNESVFIKLHVAIGSLLLYIVENSSVIISMDACTGKISYYDCLNKIRQKDGSLPKFSSVIAHGDSVFLFTTTGNSVYEIDTKFMQVTKTYKIPLNCKGIQQAVDIRRTDWVYLLEKSQGSRIIKWNIKTGEAEEIIGLPIYSASVMGLYNAFNKLYIIPQQDNCIVKIDYQKNIANRIELQAEMNLLERKDEFYCRCGNGCSFLLLAYNGNKNLSTVFLPYDFSIAEIDFDKGEFLNKRKWRVNGIEKLIRDSMKHQVDGIYRENRIWGLQEFIDDLC